MKATAATARGRETLDRILDTATRLILERGCAATTVDDVLARSGTGKSQFYHYFENKEALVRAVLHRKKFELLPGSNPVLACLDSWDGIQGWFDTIARDLVARDFVGGCLIGSIAAEAAETNEALRAEALRGLRLQGRYLERGLRSMRARGELRASADPAELAEFVVAAMQGGLLLAKTAKREEPLRRALNHALTHLRSFEADSGVHA